MYCFHSRGVEMMVPLDNSDMQKSHYEFSGFQTLRGYNDKNIKDFHEIALVKLVVFSRLSLKLNQ